MDLKSGLGRDQREGVIPIGPVVEKSAAGYFFVLRILRCVWLKGLRVEESPKASRFRRKRCGIRSAVKPMK